MTDPVILTIKEPGKKHPKGSSPEEMPSVIEQKNSSFHRDLPMIYGNNQRG
jgi:hypothetical protein